MRDTVCQGDPARHWQSPVIESLNAAVNECNRIPCRCILNYQRDKFSLHTTTATKGFSGAISYVIN